MVISLIGNSILDLSVSVCKSPGLVIDDQNSYIEQLLDSSVSKFVSNREQSKSIKSTKDLYGMIDSITDPNELISLRNVILGKLDRML